MRFLGNLLMVPWLNSVTWNGEIDLISVDCMNFNTDTILMRLHEILGNKRNVPWADGVKIAVILTSRFQWVMRIGGLCLTAMSVIIMKRGLRKFRVFSATCGCRRLSEIHAKFQRDAMFTAYLPSVFIIWKQRSFTIMAKILNGHGIGSNYCRPLIVNEIIINHESRRVD